MGFNPCICWNLKDGCVTVGIWSLIYCIAQMGIFGWQTAQIKWYKDRAANNLLPPYLGSYDTYDQRYPGYYERYYESPEERYYTGLFVVQILNLIAAFFLLFASVALIYGVHTNSKYLVWPWFPCMVTSMLCGVAYCVLWWAGNVTSYWLVLTIIEMIAVIINAYCLICVIIQYRRIVTGISDTKDPYYAGREEYHKPTAVYFDNTMQTGPTTKPIQSDWGQYNPAYDPESKYHQSAVIHQTMPAEELPEKSYPPDVYYDQNGYPQQGGATMQYPQQENPYPQEPVEADPSVQWWLNGVVNPEYPPQINNSFEQQLPNTEPSSPIKGEPPIPQMRHSKSVPSVVNEEEKSRHKHKHRNHGHRKHRSSSVGSRKSSRSRQTTSASDSDEDRGRRHRSHSRDKYSDTDTGYSHSECSTHKHRHRHQRHHSDDKHRSKRHKRPRDVKREDKERERSGRDAPEPHRPSTRASEQSWQAGKYSPAPPYPGTGGITIPQHIIIPPTKKGSHGQPQRFHINSEITISYSDKTSTNPSDSDVGRGRGWVPRTRPMVEEVLPGGPTVTSPTDGEQEYKDHRASYGESSNHGSTAV